SHEAEALNIVAVERQHRELRFKTSARVEHQLGAAHSEVVIVLGRDTMQKLEVGFLLLSDTQVTYVGQARRSDHGHAMPRRDGSRDLEERLVFVSETVSRPK